MPQAVRLRDGPPRPRLAAWDAVEAAGPALAAHEGQQAAAAWLLRDRRGAAAGARQEAAEHAGRTESARACSAQQDAQGLAGAVHLEPEPKALPGQQAAWPDAWEAPDAPVPRDAASAWPQAAPELRGGPRAQRDALSALPPFAAAAPRQALPVAAWPVRAAAPRAAADAQSPGDAKPAPVRPEQAPGALAVLSGHAPAADAAAALTDVPSSVPAESTSARKASLQLLVSGLRERERVPARARVSVRGRRPARACRPRLMRAQAGRLRLPFPERRLRRIAAESSWQRLHRSSWSASSSRSRRIPAGSEGSRYWAARIRAPAR